MKNSLEFSANKAKVSIYPIKQLRGAVLYLLIKGGYWSEEENYWGNLHLLEHLTNRATKKFPNPNKIEDFKEKFGISSNAWTSGDHLGYWFKFPDTNIDESLELVKEIIFNPLFKENLLENEKRVIFNEYQSYWENPYNRFHQKWLEQKIGKGHVFCRNALGKLENIQLTKSEFLYNLRQKYYQPQNMILSIVGNIEKETAAKKIENIFNKFQNYQPLETKFPLPKPESKLLEDEEDIKQCLVSVSWLIPGRESLNLKNRLAINMAKFILGQSQNSILYNKLRFEKGLVYNSRANITYFPNTGIFELWAKTNERAIKQAIEIIKNSVEAFFKGEIIEERYQQIKKYMDIQTIISYDSSDNIAKTIAYDLFYENKVCSPEELIKIAKDIKLENIKNLLRPSLNWKKHQLAIMKPKNAQ